MLAVPVGKQFEQVLNARYLEAEGYGLGADEITTSGSASSSSACPTSSAGSPATSRTATSTCWLRSSRGSQPRPSDSQTNEAAPTSWTSEPLFLAV